MREYELYLVIDADAEEDDAKDIVERMTQIILAGDGETAGDVTNLDVRGKRRLTYPIRKKNEGQDVILSFQTPPPALTEMERVLKLNEQVLRYLIVRTDED
jgi:small subunit ribosomal protein S6